MSLLVAERIAKRFGGVQALQDVSFLINARDIYGLIGPNGAGKTTLFNVLTGIYEPDEGEFAFDGQPLKGLKAHQVAAAGIGAHLPEHPALRQPLGARERDDRSACAHPAGVIGAVLRPAARLLEEKQIERRAPGAPGLRRDPGASERRRGQPRVRRPAPA